MNMASLLICPRCKDEKGPALEFANSAALRCSQCLDVFEVKDDIIDLEENSSLDTQLDIDEYERNNRFSESVSTSLFCSGFQPFFESVGIRPTESVCLELASGSGMLTWALKNIARFRFVYSSDLSATFLRLQKRRINDNNVCLLRFDANYIPFMSSSIDVIVGNSVLHHFLYYENTLQGVYRVLRKKGMAVFGEPMFPAHAVTSLLAGIVLYAEQSLDESSRYPMKALNALQVIMRRTSEKQHLMNYNRKALADKEDKLQFSFDALRSLSRAIGFSGFITLPELKSLSALPVGRSDIAKHRNIIENAVMKYCPGFSLDKHKKILEIFEEAYLRSYCVESPPSHFSYFALVK